MNGNAAEGANISNAPLQPLLSEQDKQQLLKKGISEEQFKYQLMRFKKGFPFLKLYAAATIGKGITKPSFDEQAEYRKIWDEYCKKHRVMKFVPASGAASRMFKDLFAFLNGSSQYPSGAFEMKFFNNISKFAFYDELNKACQRKYGKSVVQLCVCGEYKKVVSALLLPDGLNYGELPKGLLSFHKVGEEVRTPFEEHLSEGAAYACSGDGIVRLHFTVSPEHRALFEYLKKEKAPVFAKKYGVEYEISFSEQKSHTDTVAATPEGEPFRLSDGSILFRPGGHGSLIENLNELDTEVVFIKNIDNVVPDELKYSTIEEKKMLGGLLVSVQEKAFEYLKMLDSKLYSHANLIEMLQFLTNVFDVHVYDDNYFKGAEEMRQYIFQKLNRPIRICAMVKNEGEPGGGPFLVYGSDGSVQLQILESTQINMEDSSAKEMFEEGTHFNPADLVCSLRNYKGEHFNLKDFVDESTGFISSKSKDGRQLKALEHPGLWNGSMSDWNTIFVEVPSETFNPVKTVNDLLRPQHQ